MLWLTPKVISRAVTVIESTGKEGKILTPTVLLQLGFSYFPHYIDKW